MTILVLGALVFSAALFLALKLDFSTDVRDLLPKHEKRVSDYLEAASLFAGSEALVGVVTATGEAEVPLMQEFIKRFGEAAKKSDMVESADFNANQIALRFFSEFFLQNLFLFLDAEDFDEVLDSLSEQGMTRALTQARTTLISQAGLVQKELIELDPLNLRRFMHKYSPKLKQGLRLDLVDGYYFSQNHRMGFLLLYPTTAPQDVGFDRALMQHLNQNANETFEWLDQLHRWPSGSAAEKLSVSFTGAHAIMLEEGQLVRGDLSRTLISSFVLVVALFALAFRKISAVLYVGLPLVVALTLTLAICYLTTGHINVLTIVVIVSVVGLGIDFGLHLYSRYADERAAGRTAAEALNLSYARTGYGTLACAVTTSLAFLSCILSRFQGVKSLGLLAGAGILACLLTTFALLGALLGLRERLVRREARYPGPAEFGLGGLARFVSNHPSTTVTIWMCLTLLAVLQVSQVEFSEDIAKLRARSLPAVKLQTEVGAEVGGSFKDWIVFKRVDGSEDALRFSERVRENLAEMLSSGALSSTSSLLDFVPTLSRQKENIERLRRLPEDTSPTAIISRFQTAVTQAGLRMTDKYTAYIGHIASALTVTKPIDFRAATGDRGLARLLGRFLRPDGSGFHVACYLQPASLVNTRRGVLAFERRLRGVLGDEATIASTNLLTAVLKGIIKQDLWVVAVTAGLLVLIVLLVHFRKIGVALIAIVPLLCGATIMLATAALLGIDLNPINLFVIPMILGIGIDDGIHLVQRFLEGEGRIRDAISHTGKALVLTSLTTILAFGTLVFAGFHGLRQIGLFTILGVGFALLASISFLPALLAIFFRKKHIDG